MSNGFYQHAPQRMPPPPPPPRRDLQQRNSSKGSNSKGGTSYYGNSNRSAPPPPPPQQQQQPYRQQPLQYSNNSYNSSSYRASNNNNNNNNNNNDEDDWFTSVATPPPMNAFGANRSSSLESQRVVVPPMQPNSTQHTRPQKSFGSYHGSTTTSMSMGPSATKLTSSHHSTGDSHSTATPYNNTITMPQPSLFTPNSVMDDLSGPMSFTPSTTTTTTTTTTQPSSSSSHTMSYDPDDFDNEPPLLQELGIHIPHILLKSRAVILPASKFSTIDATIMDDDDLAGPLFFALLLGSELLLTAKIHFGYIYGFGMFGCLAMALLLNLMNPNKSVPVWSVISILGYSLLPVNILALLNIFVRLKHMEYLGTSLGVLTILWCTLASTRMFERGCDMRDQRYLLAYPTALLYSCFVLITIF